MTLEEWKSKNNFRDVKSCLSCKHYIFNNDWTYSCKRANQEVKDKVIIAHNYIEIKYSVCDKYEGW